MDNNQNYYNNNIDRNTSNNTPPLPAQRQVQYPQQNTPTPVQYPKMNAPPPIQYPQQYAQNPIRIPQQTYNKQSISAGIKALLIASCLVMAIIAGFVGGYVANISRPIQSTTDSTPSESLDVAMPGTYTPPEHEAAIPMPDALTSSPLANEGTADNMTRQEVAAAVRDSVVEIKTETVRTGIWSGTYISEGAGSGVIISEDGYIITNNHVISDASSITVRLVDGREFPASLIATDQRTDIAVIKISTTGLSPVVFGDSANLVIGESALAVGNPLGELGGTVTSGIISALDREMIVDGETMTLLQTDAAINPGNSGGGLFNMRAELIGIVNAKSSGLNIEGLGFAIPSNVARAVAIDLITHGYARGRTDTGLELIDIQSTQTARWYRVNNLGLYIVNSVDERLRNGDRIIEINGYVISNLYDYTEALRGLNVGDSIKITVDRNDSSISVDITLTEWHP